MTVELSRTDLERDSSDLVRDQRPWKPVVWTVERDGRKLLVKDLRYSKTLYRLTVGRFLLSREYRVYKRLRGVESIPHCFGRLDRHSIVLEFVEAESIRRVEDQLDATFFDEVERAVNRMHERGIVHMDLRHRTNIMRTASGKPYLIDFESALILGTNWLSRRFFLPMFAWVDRFALTKLRVRYCPDVVSEHDLRRFQRQTRLRRLWPFGRIWPPSRLRSRRRKNAAS